MAPATLLEAVDAHARRNPDQVALDLPDRSSLTYAAVVDEVRRVAAGLAGRGVGAGDRVLLRASSDPGFVVGYLATHAIGAIAVPLDPGLPRARRDLIESLVGPVATLDGHQPAPRRGRAVDPAPPAPDAPADILFTTGTTGVPKGVVLSHRNLVASVRNINAFVGTRSDDVEAIALPLSHSFGLGRLRCALWAGARIALVDGFGRPKRLFATIDDLGVTGLALVPAAWALLRSLSGDRLGAFSGQLRYLELGSAPMSPAEKGRLAELLPTTRICMHYGLTEASRAAFQEFHEDADRLDAVGRPGPHVRIAVKDASGHDMPAGEEGEVCVAGDMVTAGYWDDAAATVRAFHGEWFRTGDLGVLDESGTLVLVGRLTELINVGGKMVAPAEVEAAMSHVPGVVDCVCVEAPDPTSGATVLARVVGDPEAVDLAGVRHVLRNLVEAYKIPTRLEFIERVPRTSSGKIQRRQVDQPVPR